MITIRKDGFYQVENHAHVPLIGVESDRFADVIEGIREQGFKGVFCSPYHRFSGNDLSFLRALPTLEALLMRDTSLADISDIYGLKKLRYFRCNNRRPPIDYSRLSSLQKLVLEPVCRDTGVEALTELESLELWNYRPNTRDFSQLTIPPSVTELELNWVSFKHLKDLPELPKLKRLVINHCKNLVDLDLDRSKFPELECFITCACINVPEAEVERARAAYSDLAELSLEEKEGH
jgi:Leucine-rich repeat (LRR) protein